MYSTLRKNPNPTRVSSFLEAIENMAKTLKLFVSQLICIRFRDEQVLFDNN